MTRSRQTHSLFLLLIVVAVAAQLTLADKVAAPVTSLRVYLFDCGLIKGEDPLAYGLNKGDVKNPDMVVPCYLIVHPKGTLMWDVGVIPDSAFKGDKPVTQIRGLRYGKFSPNLCCRSWQRLAIGRRTSPTLPFRIIISITRRMRTRSPVPPGWSMQRNGMRCSLPVPSTNLLTIGCATARRSSSPTPTTMYSAMEPWSSNPLPGHTPGHQVLALKLPRTGPVLIAGDLWHYAAERKAPGLLRMRRIRSRRWPVARRWKHT
jgi:N-acyl homoserine lactone hydrolase